MLRDNCRHYVSQQNQIEQFAASRGVTITKHFCILELANKELQSVQKVVNRYKDAASRTTSYEENERLRQVFSGTPNISRVISNVIIDL